MRCIRRNRYNAIRLRLSTSPKFIKTKTKSTMHIVPTIMKNFRVTMLAVNAPRDAHNAAKRFVRIAKKIHNKAHVLQMMQNRSV